MNAAGVSTPLEPGELPPRAVAWLHPGQLLRTAYHVWLSTVAKEYIDRREMLAALDTIRPIDQKFSDATLDFGDTYDAAVPPVDHQSDVWIDFVADIGDSWNATYAIANLIARPKLELRGQKEPLKTAGVLVLGGDLIYPTPSREGYRKRMRSPLIAARPANQNGRAPCLLSIPGNHDWYDGLTSFVREFCQGGSLGGWQMLQRRSYFAVKLAHRWWLWGIDIALDTRIDPAQQGYFTKILEGNEFRADDNIILCTAKPAWLDKHTPASAAYRNLSYFVREIVEDRGKGCVRVILAGDLHHYSRYKNPAGDQLITAGGGGAYLHGTHQLPRQVPDLCASKEEPREPPCSAGGFEYPSRSDSRRLALRTLLLAFRPANAAFTLVVGVLYWLFTATLQVARPQLLDQRNFLLDQQNFLIETILLPAATVAFATVAATLAICAVVAASSNPASSRVRTVPWGILHGFLHLALAVAMGWVVRQYVDPGLTQWIPGDGRILSIASAASLIVIGGLAGATMFGIYLVLSDFLFGWHTNEVFVAQSIIDYRNFVRLRLRPDGSLVVYPIGLREVPRKWRFALKREAHDPFYEPADRVLAPHLIEGPIVITRRTEPRRSR